MVGRPSCFLLCQKAYFRGKNLGGGFKHFLSSSLMWIDLGKIPVLTVFFSDQAVMLVSGRVPQRSLPFSNRPPSWAWLPSIRRWSPRSLKEARDLSLLGLSSSFITTLHGKSHSISTFVAKKVGKTSCDDDGLWWCVHGLFPYHVCLVFLGTVFVYPNFQLLGSLLCFVLLVFFDVQMGCSELCASVLKFLSWNLFLDPLRSTGPIQTKQSDILHSKKSPTDPLNGPLNLSI